MTEMIAYSKGTAFFAYDSNRVLIGVFSNLANAARFANALAYEGIPSTLEAQGLEGVSIYDTTYNLSDAHSIVKAYEDAQRAFANLAKVEDVVEAYEEARKEYDAKEASFAEAHEEALAEYTAEASS